MLIAVCDDLADDRERLISCLNRYIIANELQGIEIRQFTNGTDFIVSADRVHFDVVFMDVYLGNDLGTEVVRKFAGKQSSSVIFTTTSTDFAVEAFSLKAVHYLIKPIEYAGVEDALSRCLMSKESGPVLTITSNNNVEIPILQSSIMYIEVLQKNIYFHTVEQVFEIRTTLAAVYDELVPQLFVRPHRSYIVNMKFIAQIKSDSILLKNGSEITLSRNYKNDVVEKYNGFLFKVARGEII